MKAAPARPQASSHGSPLGEGTSMTPITVLVAGRQHPVSGRPVRSRADAVAAALALSVSDQVRLLSAGDMPETVARDYLALGAPQIELLDCAADADITAPLAARLQAVAWVLTGTRQGIEPGEGVLPYALAATLNRPVISDVLSIQPEADAWIVTQALPRGARRRLCVHPPAVLAVSTSAPLTLRHSMASAAAGQVLRRPVTTVHGPEAVTEARQLVPAHKRRQMLEAHRQQSGHARMLDAIESPSTGGTVLKTGDARTKAQAVLDYLLAHSLVHF